MNRVNANYVIVPPHGCLTFEVTTPGAFRQACPHILGKLLPTDIASGLLSSNTAALMILAAGPQSDERNSIWFTP